jgi:hypothetical protein
MTDTTYTSTDKRFAATVCFNASETTWGYYILYSTDARYNLTLDSTRHDTREDAEAHAQEWIKTMENAQ